MGGKKKKHWIDKNKSVTYQLVHRDQRDPLAADSDGSALVLAPVKAYGKKVTPDMYDSLMERFFPEGRPGVDEKGKAEAELEAQYHMEESLDSDDDEYIFKRFTKPIGTATGGVFIDKTGEILEEPPAWNLQDIPSDVLPSLYEEEEGILSRGLNDVIDEEIEEALEYFDEGNYEELADDFVGELVKLSNADAKADGDELYPEIPSNASSTEEEDYGDLDDIEGLIPNLRLPPGAKVQVFEEEEERERTELDVAFDKALEEFDEESEGDSEDGPNPEACGHESIKAYTQVLDDFLERQAPIAYRHEPIQCRIWEPKKSIIEPERQRIPKAEEVIIFHEDEEIPEGGYDSADEDLKLQLTETITLQNKELTWDCETIITTYTNTENHPSLIAEPQTGLKIRLAKKTGAPLIAEFTVPPKKETVPEDEEPKENLGLARPQDESPEGKKARKQQAKEARKIAREKKKNLRTEYKTEEVKIRAENIGNLKGATVVSYGVR